MMNLVDRNAPISSRVFWLAILSAVLAIPTTVFVIPLIEASPRIVRFLTMLGGVLSRGGMKDTEAFMASAFMIVWLVLFCVVFVVQKVLRTER